MWEGKALPYNFLGFISDKKEGIGETLSKKCCFTTILGSLNDVTFVPMQIIHTDQLTK
jgi:hypothetical protein